MRKNTKYTFVMSLALLALASCGGGGGGGGGAATGKSYNVQANVSQDTCGERISPVNQTFTIVAEDGDSILVNSGLVDLSGTTTDNGFKVQFNEASGDCNRAYQADFTDVSDSNGNVTLFSTTICGENQCSSEWVGTATAIN